MNNLEEWDEVEYFLDKKKIYFVIFVTFLLTELQLKKKKKCYRHR